MLAVAFVHRRVNVHPVRIVINVDIDVDFVIGRVCVVDQDVVIVVTVFIIDVDVDFDVVVGCIFVDDLDVIIVVGIVVGPEVATLLGVLLVMGVTTMRIAGGSAAAFSAIVFVVVIIDMNFDVDFVVRGVGVVDQDVVIIVAVFIIDLDVDFDVIVGCIFVDDLDVIIVVRVVVGPEVATILELVFATMEVEMCDSFMRMLVRIGYDNRQCDGTEKG